MSFAAGLAACHIDALEFNTEELVQETRRFDDVSGKTFAMRNKETEADYRYFPDANLMPIIIDDEWLEQIKATKPVAVDEKAEAYREAGISEKEIEMLIQNHKISKLLDDVVAGGVGAKDAAAWILTDCAGVLRKDGKTLNDLTVTAEQLSAIIKMVNSGDINRNAGKKILIAVVEQGVDPVAYCKEQGLDRKVDTAALEAIIDQVIADKPPEDSPPSTASYLSMPAEMYLNPMGTSWQTSPKDSAILSSMCVVARLRTTGPLQPLCACR